MVLLLFLRVGICRVSCTSLIDLGEWRGYILPCRSIARQKGFFIFSCFHSPLLSVRNSLPRIPQTTCVYVSRAAAAIRGESSFAQTRAQERLLVRAGVSALVGVVRAAGSNFRCSFMFADPRGSSCWGLRKEQREGNYHMVHTYMHHFWEGSRDFMWSRTEPLLYNAKFTYIDRVKTRSGVGEGRPTSNEARGVCGL